jgi:hypothetical protein
MTEVRLVVRCESDFNHGKILRAFAPQDVDVDDVKRELRKIGEVLDGSSLLYLNLPGALSPIGMCAMCRGKLKCYVEV